MSRVSTRQQYPPLHFDLQIRQHFSNLLGRTSVCKRNVRGSKDLLHFALICFIHHAIIGLEPTNFPTNRCPRPRGSSSSWLERAIRRRRFNQYSNLRVRSCCC